MGGRRRETGSNADVCAKRVGKERKREERGSRRDEMRRGRKGREGGERTLVRLSIPDVACPEDYLVAFERLDEKGVGEDGPRKERRRDKVSFSRLCIFQNLLFRRGV